MPSIAPFRGVYYDPARTRGLSDVIGPPEDVPAPGQVASIIDGKPYHCFRLEFGDPERPAPPDLRQAFFDRWLDEGLLVRSARPLLYVHEHRFRWNGVYRRRLGLLAAANPREDGTAGFLPHEGVIRDNLQFRVSVLKRLRVSTSPIFTLVRDGERFRTLLEQAVEDRAPLLSGHDREEGIHRVWALDDHSLINQLREMVEHRPLYIADGHHRFAAAQAYRSYLLAEGVDPGAANRVMTLIVSDSDPGVTILPTHREIRQLGMPWATLRERIDSLFEIDCRLELEDVDPEGVARYAELLSDSADNRPEFLLLSHREPELLRLRLRDWSTVEQLIGDSVEPSVRELDVSVLHRVLLEHLLEVDPDDPHGLIGYSPDAEAIARRVLSGESELALFVRRTRIEQVLAVADAGAHMPQKSTYFYPKVPAGLMLYDLEGDENDR